MSMLRDWKSNRESRRTERTEVQEGDRSALGWLALYLAPGMGATRTVRAAAKLGSAVRALDCSLTELEAAGLPAAAAQFVSSGRGREAAESELERTRETGATIVTIDQARYPARLQQIYDPPPVLWVRGQADLLVEPGVAVVGTRHPSPYGTGMAEVLSRDLAARGLVIFSGMARGVDTAAHRGALLGGKTVAVWGTSIDVVYPKENKRLAEEILAGGGAIVSEFPLGTFPAPQNFPIRNRVISGLSVGVLVIEASEHSGTRVTARCAMEQNRDVYAVPGNVTNKNAWGPNTLIKQGAKLTATWEDVWEDLPSEVRLELEDRAAVASREGVTASLWSGPPVSDSERLVMERLRRDELMQLDELIESLDPALTSAEVFAALFELELAGRVRQMPGKHYVLTM